MTIPTHKRISFKLAAIGVLAAFLLGLVLSITQVLLDFLGQERELETRVRRILSVAERSAAQAVHNLDETLALEVVSGLLEYDFIVNARIIDDLNNELATRESSLPRTSPTRWITRYISSEYQRYELTLHKPGDNTVEYGNLSVIVDRDRALAGFFERSILVIVTGVIRSLILFFLFFGLFYFLVSKPLIKFIEKFSQIRPNQAQAVQLSPFRGHESDELGLLTATTNTFLSANERHLSERKKAEKALRKAHDEMEFKVAERTHELAEANTRLQELDRLKSMFIASMSHELRTPLNSIIGFTGVILEGMSGEINDIQRDQLQRVYGASKHLLALITDVIDISKIEAGKIDLYPESFTLDEVIGDAITAIQVQLDNKGLALDVDIPPGLPLHTDRKRLLQGILNFLSNAVKFTESGTITLFAHACNGEVEIGVTDTGIGIDAAGQAKLFQAFERLDSHLRIGTPGTGLGLYLTKKLTTELLGGTVAVESQPGKGSTFRLKIPKILRRTASTA